MPPRKMTPKMVSSGASSKITVSERLVRQRLQERREVGRLVVLLAIGLELGGRDVDHLDGVTAGLPVGHLLLLAELPVLVRAARIVFHELLEGFVFFRRFYLGKVLNRHLTALRCPPRRRSSRLPGRTTPARRKSLILLRKMTSTPFDRFRLTGRTALVTGARREIGRAIALALAGAGARLAIHHVGNDEEARDAAAVVDEIESGGGRARAFAQDFSADDAGHRLATAVSAWSPVDILVLNRSEERR